MPMATLPADLSLLLVEAGGVLSPDPLSMQFVKENQKRGIQRDTLGFR